MPHAYSVVEINEDVMIAHVERRLTSKFGHLPPDRVAGAVEKARARLQDRPIRDFIPLLIERRASAELRDNPAPPPLVTATTGD